jgi:hypothetical protein
VIQSCGIDPQRFSFETIPNGLGQHPVSAAIIHAAMIDGLLEEVTDPSYK